VCRVCLKRPEIPDERYGRCEACAKSGRIAYRFRVGPARSGGLAIKAGELSPRALRQKWRDALAAYSAPPTVKPHLGLHEVELLTTRDRLEAVRVGPDLAAAADQAMLALREAANRTDASW
jgi:hypothetical protein